MSRYGYIDLRQGMSVNLKHVTAVVVIGTVAILAFVPAPGEQNALGGSNGGRGGGGSGKTLDLLTGEPHPECKDDQNVFPCVIETNGRYTYITSYLDKPSQSTTKYYACKSADGKHNHNKYPCIWDRRKSLSGSNEPNRFLVYWSK